MLTSTSEEVMMRSLEDVSKANPTGWGSRRSELPIELFSLTPSSTLTSPSTPSSSCTLSSPLSDPNGLTTTLVFSPTTATILNIPLSTNDALNNNNLAETNEQQQQQVSKIFTTSTPLPEILESIQKAVHLPTVRHRWNTNEEIASLLIALERHDEWLLQEVKLRPRSGSMMLYSRKRVRYRRDGYCWKKRKDGKTTREDHMKLKVQGIECIYGCYVHSAILPTFHRRCYWLLQNPDIVLVHYLNVPYNDDNKMISPTLNYFSDSKKEWTKDDLICELKPMFFNETDNELNERLESSTMETIETIVQQLMVRQRAKLKSIEIEEIVAHSSTANMDGIAQRGQCSKTIRLVNNKTNHKTMLSTIDDNNNNNNQPRPPASHEEHHNERLVCMGDHLHQRVSPQSSERPRLEDSPVISLSNDHQHQQHNITRGETMNSVPTSLILNLSQIHTTNGSSFILVNSLEPQQSVSNFEDHHSLMQQQSSQTMFFYDHNDLDNNGVKEEQDDELMMITSEPATPEPMGTSTSRSSPFMLDSVDNFDSIDTLYDVESNMITCNYLVSSYPCGPSTTTTLSTAPSRDMSLNLNLLSQQHSSSQSSSELNVVKLESDDNESSNDMASFMDNHNLTTAGDASLFTFDEAFDLFNFDHLVDDHFDTPLDNTTSNGQYSSKSNHATLNPFLSNLAPSSVCKNSMATRHRRGRSALTHSEQTGNYLDENGNVFAPTQMTSKTASPNLTRHHSSLGCKDETLKPVERNSSAKDKTKHGETKRVTITDYSPEWCYPEGGIKVLVAGPWSGESAAHYSILFNCKAVPTELVQTGLLRCFSPRHSPGLVSLQVSCNDVIISKAVSFEYRQRDASIKTHSRTLDWSSQHCDSAAPSSRRSIMHDNGNALGETLRTRHSLRSG